DYCVQSIHLFYDVLPDMAFGRTPKQNPMRKHTGHDSVVPQLVQHMGQKSIIGLCSGCQLSVLAKTFISTEKRIGIAFPMGRKRWICHDGLEAFLQMLWILQGIFLLYTEISVMDIM